jgi:hypothetical protein
MRTDRGVRGVCTGRMGTSSCFQVEIMIAISQSVHDSPIPDACAGADRDADADAAAVRARKASRFPARSPSCTGKCFSPGQDTRPCRSAPPPPPAAGCSQAPTSSEAQAQARKSTIRQCGSGPASSVSPGW